MYVVFGLMGLYFEDVALTGKVRTYITGESGIFRCSLLMLPSSTALQ